MDWLRRLHAGSRDSAIAPRMDTTTSETGLELYPAIPLLSAQAQESSSSSTILRSDLTLNKTDESPIPSHPATQDISEIAILYRRYHPSDLILPPFSPVWKKSITPAGEDVREIDRVLDAAPALATVAASSNIRTDHQDGEWRTDPTRVPLTIESIQRAAFAAYTDRDLSIVPLLGVGILATGLVTRSILRYIHHTRMIPTPGSHHRGESAATTAAMVRGRPPGSLNWKTLMDLQRAQGREFRSGMEELRVGLERLRVERGTGGAGTQPSFDSNALLGSGTEMVSNQASSPSGSIPTSHTSATILTLDTSFVDQLARLNPSISEEVVHKSALGPFQPREAEMIRTELREWMNDLEGQLSDLHSGVRQIDREISAIASRADVQCLSDKIDALASAHVQAASPTLSDAGIGGDDQPLGDGPPAAAVKCKPGRPRKVVPPTGLEAAAAPLPEDVAVNAVRKGDLSQLVTKTDLSSALDALEDRLVTMSGDIAADAACEAMDKHAISGLQELFNGIRERIDKLSSVIESAGPQVNPPSLSTAGMCFADPDRAQLDLDRPVGSNNDNTDRQPRALALNRLSDRNIGASANLRTVLDYAQRLTSSYEVDRTDPGATEADCAIRRAIEDASVELETFERVSVQPVRKDSTSSAGAARIQESGSASKVANDGPTGSEGAIPPPLHPDAITKQDLAEALRTFSEEFSDTTHMESCNAAEQALSDQAHVLHPKLDRLHADLTAVRRALPRAPPIFSELERVAARLDKEYVRTQVAIHGDEKAWRWANPQSDKVGALTRLNEDGFPSKLRDALSEAESGPWDAEEVDAEGVGRGGIPAAMARSEDAMQEMRDLIQLVELIGHGAVRNESPNDELSASSSAPSVSVPGTADVDRRQESERDPTLTAFTTIQTGSTIGSDGHDQTEHGPRSGICRAEPFYNVEGIRLDGERPLLSDIVARLPEGTAASAARKGSGSGDGTTGSVQPEVKVGRPEIPSTPLTPKNPSGNQSKAPVPPVPNQFLTLERDRLFRLRLVHLESMTELDLFRAKAEMDLERKSKAPSSSGTKGSGAGSDSDLGLVLSKKQRKAWNERWRVEMIKRRVGRDLP